jgi:hypothetical protein
MLAQLGVVGARVSRHWGANTMNKLTLIAVCAGVSSVLACSSGGPARDAGLDSKMDSRGAGGTGARGSGGSGVVGVGGSGETGGMGVGGSGGSSGAGGPPDNDGSVDGQQDTGADGGRVFPPPTTCAGYAMRLDGLASYASINRVVQGDFTIEAWIKTTASASGTNFWQGVPVVYADLAGTHLDFGTTILNNHFSIGVGNAPGAGDTTVEGTSVVNSGDWVHVAATRSVTGQLQVIVNGILERSVSSPQTGQLTDAPTMYIGANLVDFRYFTGDMDEVRVWTVARTPEQIAATMHARLAGDEAGLVGYWRFDEPGVAVPVDSSPTPQNAALNGSVDWAASLAPVCGVPDGGVTEPPADGGAGGATGDAGTDRAADAANTPPDAPADMTMDTEAGTAPLAWRAFLPLATGANATTLDVTANGYNATYVGPTITFAGSRLNLTGAVQEYVAIPPKAGVGVIDVTRSYSVSAWAVLSDLSGVRTIVGGEGSVISSFFLQKSNGTAGKWAFTLRSADTTSSTSIACTATAAGAAALTLNALYHVVATRDAATGLDILYVNGAESGRNTCPGAAAGPQDGGAAGTFGWADTGNMGIGHGLFTSFGDRVIGSISGVGLIDRVLTAQEVADLYARGVNYSP